ncbi:DinB family protein [Alkalihalobacillus sp. LMS39]|uniref:DinB family protein n=1 Tax=Alkalihalobacillus sp. LMS39 TaxID=2924032 RepID=UPI001FB38F8A|nr:DinB family protein [Alkalihalobacillus sp. LMS39]UOE95799.1 DinB family protein [Alkalihalobacillus sp. LMS39]
MNFSLPEAIEVLERTPKTLEALLSGLSTAWLTCREGEKTWNAKEVVEHFIYAEKQNWIPRLQTILEQTENKAFPPFDRFAHLQQASGSKMEERITEFHQLRQQNIAKLKQLVTVDQQLELTGIHPEFGEVKTKELLATWVVHDLTHLAQIGRVMAKRYSDDVGPWKAYISILNAKT